MSFKLCKKIQAASLLWNMDIIRKCIRNIIIYFTLKLSWQKADNILAAASDIEDQMSERSQVYFDCIDRH